jgi:spermidine synthase
MDIRMQQRAGFSPSRGCLLAAMFLWGATCAVSQIVLVREFVVVFFGSELCLGMILAGWLAGVAAGAALGVRLGRRLTASAPAALACFLALGALTTAALCVIRSLQAILRVPTGEYAPFGAMALSIAAISVPLGAVVGLAFPLTCAAARRPGRDEASEIGAVYAIESLGSIAGGLIFTYALVSHRDSFRSILIVNGACLAAAWLACRAWRLRLLGIAALALLSAHAALVVTGADTRLNELTVRRRWHALNPRLPLLRSLDSRYQHLVLTEQDGLYTVFGNGQCVFSFPNEPVSGGVAHLTLCEHPRPKRLLVIGGGMGGLLQHALMHAPERVDYVELDPAEFRIVDGFLPPDEVEALRDSRVFVHPEDGRRFVQRMAGNQAYDVVLVNLPDPSTAMMNRFYTVEFFAEIRRVLAPGGILATRITSAVNYLGEEVGGYSGAVFHTLRAVFPHVVVTPGETQFFFAATEPGIVTSDMKILASRFESRNIRTDFFSPHHFAQYFETAERAAAVQREFEAMQGLPVNSDLRPVVYFLSLRLWDRFSGGHLGPALRLVGRARWEWLAAGAAGFVVIRLLWLAGFRRTRAGMPRFNALAAIGVAGFAAMALELALLFAYQSLCGFVYQKIGLILAMFMAGLASGAAGMGRLLSARRWNWTLCLAILQGLSAAFALAIPGALRWLCAANSGAGGAAQTAIPALVSASGLLTGALFPLASRVYLDGAPDIGRAAGWINCIDHAGGFAGALLTGVLLAPVLGIPATCGAVAILCAMSALLALTGLGTPKRWT